MRKATEIIAIREIIPGLEYWVDCFDSGDLVILLVMINSVVFVLFLPGFSVAF